MVASFTGRLETCALLLERGAQQHPDIIGKTPLHAAAEKGHAEVCRLLLDRGADHQPDNWGHTPLYVAALEGQVEVCRVLLSSARCGATHESDKRGATPLHLAALKGHVQVCKLLLDHGATNVPDKKQLHTPLHVAAQTGNVGICKLILEREGTCAAQVQTKQGSTPLFLAARNGHEKVCELLLDRGDSVHTPADFKKTPLYAAAHEGRKTVCELLLDRGATHDPDAFGRTPLYMAVQGRHEDVCEVLLNRGAGIPLRSFGRDPRRVLTSESTPVSIRAMLAQRFPRLFWKFPTHEARSVNDLILAVHTLLPDQPRHAVLDMLRQEFIESSRVTMESTSADVIELISIFSAVPPFEMRDSESMTDAQRIALERGTQVRSILKEDPSSSGRGGVAFPRWIWRRVIISTYGIPEAWLGDSFWSSCSKPCEGRVRLVT